MPGKARVRGGSCGVEYYVKTKERTDPYREITCENTCHDKDGNYVRVRYKCSDTHKEVDVWFELEDKTHAYLDWYEKSSEIPNESEECK